jgi:hypothetical protein
MEKEDIALSINLRNKEQLDKICNKKVRNKKFQAQVQI